LGTLVPTSHSRSRQRLVWPPAYGTETAERHGQDLQPGGLSADPVSRSGPMTLLYPRCLPDAGENLHGIALLEVERDGELQRRAGLVCREPNRDLRGPAAHGFPADKLPIALINQGKAQSPKLHRERVAFGPD